MYTVLAPERDRLAEHLRARGIGTQVIYPRLVPDQKAYREAPHRSVDLPVARRLVPQLLCLPMFAELTDDEVERVCEAIVSFYA
jgi:dTDP-4-amino-4,6-dideoxygalactose transaminase